MNILRIADGKMGRLATIALSHLSFRFLVDGELKDKNLFCINVSKIQEACPRMYSSTIGRAE